MGKDQEFLEAARNGNITLFEKILIQKSKRGGPLASLRRGPGINVQDSVGYSALHYSALNGHTDIVRLLLFHDASPNLLDSRGSSALHLAAWAGHQEIVKMLLTHPYKPANPDMQTMENETPLHCAAQHGHTGALTTLLAHGADPNVRNNRNETPLDLAAQYGRLQAVQMLIRAHPELLQPYSIETDSTSSSVSSGGAAAAVVNHSALHLASRNGHNNVVEILLAAGVNVNLLTPSGTALHEAALCGKDVVVRTLLEHGADLNATDSENRTPLDVLQEFPPHVTKSIISVINSFRSHENEDLYDRYASEETDEPSSTMGKENKLGFPNHSDSISASVLTQSFEQSNLSEHQAQVSSNGELADFYVKMEPIKIQKAAPKKPPRRNLSISPTHLQNFFLNNELIRHNMEICGNNTAAENTALQASSENSLQNQASYGYICTNSSGSAIYSSEENLINSNNPTTGRNSSWYSHSEDMEKAPTTDFKPVPAPRKLKNSFQSFENATLKSYNPNRRLKRNREHYFAKGQFSLAISTSCGKQQHLPENLRTSNPTPGKNEKITSRRPLSQEHKFPPDYLHQNLLEEAGISPQDNNPLSLCNSSGSISSGVSLSDRSLSTDCVEEYVGDEPFAGLFKGSTMNLSKVCSNKTKGFYSSNNEYHSKSSVIRSRRDLEDIYKHAASSTTDSQSESSDEASITIMNDKVNIRSRIKRDKRLGSDRRNKFKESQNIRKIRPFSSCENNTQKMTSSTSAAMMKNADWKNDCSSSSGTPPASSSAAMINVNKSISVKNDQSSPSVDVKPTNMASCRPSKILSSYNEQEAWDKLSQIMETFGNSTLNGLNSFWDPDDINQSREYDKLAKLLDKNGLRHLERSLYNSGYDNFRFLNGIIDDKDLPGMNISGEDAQKLMTFVKTLPYVNFMTLAVDATLDQWLKSIQLIEYSENFKKHLYNTLKSVCGVWEIELQTVLEINKIGHRKRILHSVAQIRQAGDVKSSCDNITNKNSTSKENNPKGTLGHPKKNRPAPKPPIKTLEIRAPSELLIGLPHNLHIKWPHSTCSLISNSLNTLGRLL
ncbi:ankyrin repeat and sterile alpha motif domain-containing protein 1B isoform X2 [Episyrphus balteatus]|uniref:ankyrin repeat and sterile alpha motif domain-containing protein 1B isoform X2 n=1 Tax=Episyrphus balteatus TaxID=286459 RepID=UPI00248547ED|nr:ankyrin repeat and sterile alpha motif domain-containing protein 1B isoform X2 [Episyrphus balteatus]